jgi:hypothetical protein
MRTTSSLWSRKNDFGSSSDATQDYMNASFSSSLMFVSSSFAK